MLIYLAMIESDEDKSKFEIIYDTYKKLMLYEANKILMDTHDTEDVVHYTETEYISYKDMYTPYSEELGEPIGQVIQTVYVKETFDDNGMILESRLMNKQEADEYKAEVAERLRSGEQVRVAPNGMQSFPASDSTSQGELTITLTVYKFGATGYKGLAKAQWTSGVWILPDGEERPSVGKDYLAITWGGNGEIKQKSKSISGIMLACKCQSNR